MAHRLTGSSLTALSWWRAGSVGVAVVGLALATAWLVHDSSEALSAMDPAQLQANSRSSDPLVGLRTRSSAQRVSEPPAPHRRHPSGPGSRVALEAARAGLTAIDAHERREAVAVLESIGTAAAAAELTTALADPDVRVRRLATDALASMPARARIAGAERALHDEDALVRRIAIDVLGESGLPAVFDALLIALHDADAGVRLDAVDTLAEMPGARAQGLLQIALGDRDPAIRAAAAESLAGD